MSQLICHRLQIKELVTTLLACLPDQLVRTLEKKNPQVVERYFCSLTPVVFTGGLDMAAVCANGECVMARFPKARIDEQCYLNLHLLPLIFQAKF